MNKIIIFTVILVLIAGVLIFYFDKDGASIKKTYKSSGEITKIIYEVNDNSPLSVCEQDCLERNGFFQECGNICEPGADVCDTVCAVTCTLSD